MIGSTTEKFYYWNLSQRFNSHTYLLLVNSLTNYLVIERTFEVMDYLARKSSDSSVDSKITHLIHLTINLLVINIFTKMTTAKSRRKLTSNNKVNFIIINKFNLIFIIFINYLWTNYLLSLKEFLIFFSSIVNLNFKKVNTIKKIISLLALINYALNFFFLHQL